MVLFVDETELNLRSLGDNIKKKLPLRVDFFFLGNLESLFTRDQPLWTMKTEFNLCTLGHNINKNRQLEKGEVECLQRKFQDVPFCRSLAFSFNFHPTFPIWCSR